MRRVFDKIHLMKAWEWRGSLPFSAMSGKGKNDENGDALSE